MTPPWRRLLLILAVALLARVAAGLWLGLDGPPRGDERGYALLAASLARGEGLRLPVPEDVLAAAGVTSQPALRAFRTPLVPLALAPVAALGGGLAAMRLLTLLLGALCAPLLFLASRSLAGERAATWAALGYALWPPHVFVSVHALSEPLSMALLVLAAGCAARAPGGSGGRAGLLAGVLAGLAILARPAAVLPAVLLAPATGDRRRALLLLLGVAVVLAPWVIRNDVLLGRPLLTTHSGVTLLGGNCPAAAAADPPGKWLPPEQVFGGPDRVLARRPELGMWGWVGLDEAASDRRFTALAVDWVRSSPADAARLAGWKLVRLLDPDPRSRKSDAGTKTWLGWLTLPPVLLLALVGVAGLRDAPPGWRPWLALLVGTVVTAAIFYGDTRMRTAADPTLLLLASSGAGRLLGRRAGGAGPPS